MIRLARIVRFGSQRGQTAVEFSLCALVFFMIVFGLLKVATIYGDYVALQHAARDGSRKGSVTRGTGNANQAAVTTAVTAAVKSSSSFLSPTDMNITVTPRDSYTAPNGTLWEPHDRIEVTVDYPWKLDVLGLPIWSGRMSTTTEAIIE
jgi:Flp pilus assembly protein TadG